MIDKTVTFPAATLADVPGGATVTIGGFGAAGQPDEPIDGQIAPPAPGERR